MPSEWIARHNQTVTLKGEWTLANYRHIKAALQHSETRTEPGKPTDATVSLDEITRLDTAGAILIGGSGLGSRTAERAAGVAGAYCRSHGSAA